jgi:hypothetical protein
MREINDSPWSPVKMMRVERILFALGLVRLRRLVGDMRIPTMDPEKPRGNLTIQLFQGSLDHSSSTPPFST